MDNQYSSRLLSEDVTPESLQKLEYKTTRIEKDPQSDDERVKKLEKEYEYFSKKNDQLKAFGCLEKILLLQPNSYFGFLREGDIFSDFKRYDEAQKSYKKCIEIDEQDGRAQNNMGNVFQKLGQHKKAIKCYSESTKHDPTDPIGFVNQGNSLNDLGQHKKAIKCYSESNKHDPTSPIGWGNLGDTLHELGQREKAIECYNKAIKRNEKWINALYGKAWALSSLQQHKEAIKCFIKTIKIDKFKSITDAHLINKAKKIQ